MKKKVLLLHNQVAPYRLELFEKLSQIFNLTVYFCQTKSKRRKWGASLQGFSFKREILKNFVVKNLIINYTLGFKLLKNKFDVYVAGESPEVVFSTFLVLLASKLFRKPFILWSGFIEAKYIKTSKIKNKVRKFYQKILYHHTDSFIAYGKKAKKYLIKNGVAEEKIFIGTQTTPEKRVKQSIEKAKTKFKNKKIILYLGYLQKRKGVDWLIKAFKELKDENTVLIIAGTGEDEEKLKKMVQDNKNIYFVGYVQGKEKANYYNVSDIFVLPTLHDPWPQVILEAMSFGLPIITTRADGSAEELIKDNGIVIEPTNKDELKEALNLLLDNKILQEKMSRKSQQIAKKFDINYALEAFKKAIDYASK